MFHNLLKWSNFLVEAKGNTRSLQVKHLGDMEHLAKIFLTIKCKSNFTPPIPAAILSISSLNIFNFKFSSSTLNSSLDCRLNKFRTLLLNTVERWLFKKIKLQKPSNEKKVCILQQRQNEHVRVEWAIHNLYDTKYVVLN